MLKEIWREIRDDVKSRSIHWRPLTAGKLHDCQPKLNSAARLPMLRGVDAAGNPYGADLSKVRLARDHDE